MTKKMTKSWIITLIAFGLSVILPIVDNSLEQFNIIITEAELTHYVTLLLVSGGFGTAASIRKQLTQRKTELKPLSEILTKTGKAIKKSIPGETIAIVNNKTGKKLQPPVLGPVGSWYKTNFKKSDRGNSLEYGQSYLWIKYEGVRSYVSAILMTADKVPIQIDQSSEFDEDNDIETTRLELFLKDGSPLPRGKYILQSQGDRGSGDSQGIRSDEFSII